MTVDIKIPSVGESITEARLVRWLKQDGEFVRADEAVAELETDKASDTIPSPADGIIHTVAKPDDVVAIGAVIGRIEPGQPASTAAKQTTRPETTKTTPVPSPPAVQKKAEQKTTPPIAAETKQVESVAPQQSLPPRPSGEREVRAKMSPIRQRIAERLVQSQHATATLTTFNEADMSEIVKLRASSKDQFKVRHGVGLGFMPFFVKAVVGALKKFPTVNARIDGTDIVHQNFYDIGVAVSTERGLMVPILRDADQLSFADIEQTIDKLALLARDGKISTSHLQGGTFTITNGGVFGSLLSTPILNPPQCAILGMHTIQKRPVVIDDEIAIRSMMYLALSYDHRLIDGKEAVQFLVAVKESIENPWRIMLEV